jgi:sugar/nucleoside kinase (ribokinase family)
VDVTPVVVRSDEATGVSVVLSSPADRTIYTAAGATAALRPDDLDAGGMFGSSRHVHVASYFLQDALRPGLGDLLEAARVAGATTSLDPNWDPRERWDPALVEILDRVDVFLPNEAELLAITGHDDVERASAALAERAGAVVVKRGAAGALARRGDEIVRVAAVEIEPVDTTGAGDAFDAGFVHAHLEGWPLDRSLAFANACGALSCRSVGGVDAQPTLDEALALASR